MNIQDPFDLIQTLLPDGKKVFLSHNDLRSDYGDHSIFRIAYIILAGKYSTVITEGNVKKFDIGYGKDSVNIDREYLHSVFDLDEIPDSESFEYFENIVNERLPSLDLPDVDLYVGRGGGYFFDNYDWISLHRLAEMLYYANKGVPVGLFPSTVFFNNKKLLNIFKGVAKKCKFIIAREPITYSWLANYCDLKDNIHLSWDLGLLETPKESEKTGKIGVILTTDKIQTKSFEQFIERNNNLLFFSTAPKKDERRLRYSTVETGGEYKYILSLDDLLLTINSCSAVVSDRYHGVVFSYLQNTPVFPLKERLAKTRGFLEMVKFYKPLTPLEKR